MKRTWITTGIVVMILAVLGTAVWRNEFRSQQTSTAVDLTTEIGREQAVREVEVSLWEASNAIFYYMFDPTATSLEEYRKQLVDVENFMNQYRHLTDRIPETSTMTTFDDHWYETVQHSESLVEIRDTLSTLKHNLRKQVYALQHSLLNESTLILNETVPHLQEKQDLIHHLAMLVWQVAFEADYSTDHPQSQTHKHFLATAQEIESTWNTYHRLEVSIDELAFTDALQSQCREFIEQLRLATEMGIKCRQQCLALWESTHASDDIIDFDMQEAIEHRLAIGLANETRQGH